MLINNKRVIKAVIIIITISFGILVIMENMGPTATGSRTRQTVSYGRLNHGRGSVDVLYEGADKLIALKAQVLGEKAVEIISRRLNFRDDTPIILHLWRDRNSFTRAMTGVLSYDRIRLSGAVAFVTIDEIHCYLKDYETSRRFIDNRDIAHEISHISIHRKIRNNLKNTPIGIPLAPLWIHEGMALYFEKLFGDSPSISGIKKQVVEDMQNGLQPLQLSSLNFSNRYDKLDDYSKVCFYWQSFEMMNYIAIKHGGVEAFLQILDALIRHYPEFFYESNDLGKNLEGDKLTTYYHTYLNTCFIEAIQEDIDTLESLYLKGY